MHLPLLYPQDPGGGEQRPPKRTVYKDAVSSALPFSNATELSQKERPADWMRGHRRDVQVSLRDAAISCEVSWKSCCHEVAKERQSEGGKWIVVRGRSDSR